MNGRRNAFHLALAFAALAALIVLLLLSGRQGALPPAISAQAAAAPQQAGATVSFTPAPGAYDGPLTVHLSTDQPSSAIYFTTDGSLPTPDNSTLYSKPITLPGAQPRVPVLRARILQADGSMGPTTTAFYLLNQDADIPIVSLAVDPQSLWDEATGIFANPGFHGRAAEREAELFYYDPQLGTGVQAAAGLRVHGARSRLYDKLSMRLYFRDEYGDSFLEYPIFPDSEATRFKRLVLHDGGQEFPAVSLNGTLLRNHLVGNLVRQAGGYATYSRPTLVFINGELWGIYNIRERIDDRYLEEQFQIEQADLLSGFEYRLEAQAGDLVHWDNLMEFVAAHDLADPDNYAFVQTQVNLDNLIDYTLIQIITANADWPHNNQLKFRDRAGGRWHWMFWDSDYAFGLLSDSYIAKDMYDRIFEPVDERQAQSTLLLRKLLENPQFKNQFLARLADLLNTIFAPENVLAEIDQLAAAVDQDIPLEIRRWPGAGDWAASVDYLREFARQRPALVRQHTIDRFALPGLALLTIDQPQGGRGMVRVNDDAPLGSEQLPWRGEYFQGVEIQLTAVPEPGYRFAGWGAPDLPPEVDLALTLNGDRTVTPHFERANSQTQLARSVRIINAGRDSRAAPLAGVEGEWLELQVQAPGGADLRGWRITDNDGLAQMDEGSLFIGDHPSLANVPPGTTLLLIIGEMRANSTLMREDDLSPLDGRLVLYSRNELLNSGPDPWFASTEGETLTLFAPGPTADRADDILIDSFTVRTQP